VLGCKEKEPEHYYHYFPIPAKLKLDGYFSIGSYWIYKNDSTGAVDCILLFDVPAFSMMALRSGFSDLTIDLP
jgi:hypothetical protein